MLNRPNILFLFSDQHNPSVLGHTGNQVINTPTLDQFSSQGVTFENAYCQNPLCVPSRASLITGRYSRNIGIYENQHILEPNCVTFPRVLSGGGYRTCVIGKTHFNGEQYHGYQARPYGDLYGQAHQPDPRRTPDSGASGLGGLVGNAGPSGIPLPMTQTEICVSESAKWLQTHIDLHADQPFCLSVHFDKPHFPVRPPAEYFSKYDGRINPPEVPEGYYNRAVPFVRMSMNRFASQDEDCARYLAAYYGCVEWVDNAIGRLLQVLDYLELSENTVVVYASDHGDLCGEKGAWNKTLFLDASAKVPLQIRYPGKFPAGLRITAPVGLIDLFPTFCDLAQMSVPEECDGQSLMPLLSQTGTFEREEIYCESAFLGSPQDAGCMIRKDQWKYCYYRDGHEELYNLAEDPGEWNNLASHETHRTVQEALRERVITFWSPEEYEERLLNTPRINHQKHFYEFSNQFVLGSGTVANARP